MTLWTIFTHGLIYLIVIKFSNKKRSQKERECKGRYHRKTAAECEVLENLKELAELEEQKNL